MCLSSYQPFTIGGLKGFLDVCLKESVTFINAPYLAKDRGIVVVEAKTDQYDKFNDLILFALKTDEEEISIAGTVFADKLGRIVLVNRFHLEIVPKGPFSSSGSSIGPGSSAKWGPFSGATA